MRILYYTWNENSQRDMAESLVKLGYNVSCCNIPFSNYEEDKCFTDNLEKIFKRPIYGLAYPNGSYDNRIVDIAKSVGIKYARVTNDKYAATKAAEAYAANADGPMLIEIGRAHV